MLADGLVAFFFDGLDEIVSHEARARVFAEIVGLVANAFASGNRFVVTSRPAAVRFLQIPPRLKVLSLRGLSESEIRLLASRVVAAEAVGSDAIRFKQPDTKDETTVERLLRDCQANQSIAKLASNPLLLTLLALIYVNGGTLAARRHRIYEQAVQTLVSVRNRVAGQNALSETDLRKRLGEVALCLFAPEPQQMATVDRLVARLGLAMDARGEQAPQGYLQAVAERTGLLVLNDVDGKLTSISFMHYSFLEYYAAVGLIASRSDEALAGLALLPAWRDVLEVVCGIRSDKDDVSPLLEKIMATRTTVGRISGETLLLVLDCALECDVPPERSQELLAREVADVMKTGPGHIDAGYRSDLADRIARLLIVSGSQAIQDMLARGLSVGSATQIAAFVDLVAKIGTHTPIDDALLAAIDGLCTRKESAIVIAIANGVKTVPALRRPAQLQLVRRALGMSRSVRQSAVMAVSSNPALAAPCQRELQTLLRDASTVTSAAAAKALIEGFLREQALAPHNRQLLDQCLRAWNAFFRPNVASRIVIRIDWSDLSKLLGADDQSERLLALRLLPWVESPEADALPALCASLRSNSPVEVKVALGALYSSPGLMARLPQSDIDLVFNLLRSTREVRAAAYKVLGSVKLQRDGAQRLVACLAGVPHEDLVEGLSACVQQAERIPEITGEIHAHLLSALAPSAGIVQSKEVARVKSVLALLADVGGVAPSPLVARVLGIAQDYRVPLSVRAQAIVSYGDIAQANAVAIHVPAPVT